MKKLKLLLLTFIGIMASSSGMIQVGAALYTFNVDFSTKEVADFNLFKQTFSTDTYNLDAKIVFYWSGTYFFDSCTPGTALNSNWSLEYRLNASGSFIGLGEFSLPDLLCTTTPATFSASYTYNLPGVIIDAIVNDDANFVQFQDRILFRPGATFLNKTITLRNYTRYFNLQYDFNTTYLFNYFLSDQQYSGRNTTGSTWTFGATGETKLDYLYTTAGNDEYRIVNTDFLADLGTLRKKYAVDYNEEFFRGESIGAQFRRVYNGDDAGLLTSSTGTINERYNYYYLNASNLAQAIVDAPVFNFTYQDCGSFLALNVGCFINNGLAYITNDAPIISDAITLLNAGIGLAAQTFGIIGSFSDDNVFGWLILVGFGFIAVKWFLKND